MKIIFDTETTGLPKNYNAPASDLNNWPRICQLSWIVIEDSYDGKNHIEVGDFIIKPDGWVIPEEVSKIHGITQKMAEETGVPIKDALRAFIEAVRKVNTIIAHNISFDDKVVGAEIFRMSGNAEYWESLKAGKKMICTMKSSINFCALPNLKWPKLVELHQELFGTEFEGAHNALFDVLACAKCYQELVKIKVIV